MAWVRVVRIGVLLPLALVGVAATGAVPRAVASRVAVEANTIYLGAHTERNWSWSLSLDQAVTWTPAGEDETAGFTTRFLLPVTKSCSVADPRICYRVMPDELGVQASNDGGATWTTSWQADAAERKRLAREYSEPAFHNPELSSVSLGVHDVPGGHIVIVANGLEGFRQRDLDGTWRRIGMPALFGSGAVVRPSVYDPATDRVDDILRVVAVALLLATAVICIGGALSGRRQGRAYRWYIGLLLGISTTLPLAVFRGPNDFFAYTGPALSIVVSLVAGLVSLLAPAGLKGRWEWALRVLGAALLTALIGAGCCVLWVTGVIPGWVAAPLCLAAVVPGALLAQRAAADLPSPARGP